MAELVYAADLKSVAARLEGSSPSLPTIETAQLCAGHFQWQLTDENPNERVIASGGYGGAKTRAKALALSTFERKSEAMSLSSHQICIYSPIAVLFKYYVK